MATTFEIEVIGLDEVTGRTTFVATGTDGEVSHTVRCTGQIDTNNVAASVKAKVLPTLVSAYAEKLAEAAESVVKTAIVDTLKAELEKAQVVA